MACETKMGIIYQNFINGNVSGEEILGEDLVNDINNIVNKQRVPGRDAAGLALSTRLFHKRIEEMMKGSNDVNDLYAAVYSIFLFGQMSGIHVERERQHKKAGVL
jgi:hypothetical protein